MLNAIFIIYLLKKWYKKKLATTLWMIIIQIVYPPSAKIWLPFIKDDKSEAKNSATFAISIGAAYRLSSVASANFFLPSSILIP